MESSQITGDAEECHSNESGWTMYIGSSIDAADDDHSEQGDDDGDKDSVGEHSDDSMVSDASSGPSHPLKNGEEGYCRIVEVKHVDPELYGSKHGADKKAKNPKQKKEMWERITENEEKIFKEKKSKASVQVSGDKVRKSLSLGNKK